MARGKKRVRLVVALALVLVGGAGIWWVIKINTSPAVGRIEPPKLNLSQNSQSSEPPKTYEGKYVDVSYPSSYHTVPLQLTGNRLEVAELVGKNRERLTLSISPAQGSLDEDSGVRLRRHDIVHYSEQPWQLGPDNGVVFTGSADGFEKTGFIIHKNYLATITFSDPFGQDQDHQFEEIVNNLVWHE